jgi:hypothetical protein
LDEVFLLMPSANPTTGGSDIETTNRPGQVDTPGALWGPAPGAADPPRSEQTSKARINRIKERSSALNHIGQLESWGIGPATPVQDVTLRISTATGAQLKDILKKLPDGLTFDLSLEQEES